MEKTPRPCKIPYLILLFGLLTCGLYADVGSPSSYYSPVALRYEIKVGVILDMGSLTGKSIYSCITMALSDFYASNGQYRTRIILHLRDSQGQSMLAISAALDLLENVNVHAIIGPDTYLEKELLEMLEDKARVPIFSFNSTFLSSSEYPFLVQIKQDDTFQFRGIAAILKSYDWRTINVIYEDGHNGRDILPCLADNVQEENI